MLIRVEIPIDAPGIDALLRRSFESDAEAKLVHDLREDGFLTLGLVATDDEGQVIGYVAFSPVDVQGEDLQWVGMAPLAVDEKYRGQGLARQLVYEGLDSLNEFGYAAVVTLGDRSKQRMNETLFAPLFRLLPGNWKSIDARDVARVMLAEAMRPGHEGVTILSSSELRKRAE